VMGRHSKALISNLKSQIVSAIVRSTVAGERNYNLALGGSKI